MRAPAIVGRIMISVSRWPLLTLILVAACARPGVVPTQPETGRSSAAVGLPSPRATSPVPPKPRCVDGVEISAGETSAAMGLRAMGIELVNCGTVPYTVNGYPAVRVLDEGRAPLPVAVIHGSAGVATLDNFDTPPTRVTAAPGERLAFGLVWRNTVTDTTVDPVNATYLEIVPAPGQVPQTVRPEGRLDLGTTGRLGITAWSRATR